MPVAWAPPSVLPAPLPAGFPEIQHRDADLPVRFTGPDAATWSRDSSKSS